MIGSDRQLSTGEPVPADHSHAEIEPTSGMQRGYVVLTPAERAKGFIKPLRRSYIHKCGVSTRMGQAIAETYARDPMFYNATFCVGCKAHFPLVEFAWEPDGEPMDPTLQAAWHGERWQAEQSRGDAAKGQALRACFEALRRALRFGNLTPREHAALIASMAALQDVVKGEPGDSETRG